MKSRRIGSCSPNDSGGPRDEPLLLPQARGRQKESAPAPSKEAKLAPQKLTGVTQQKPAVEVDRVIQAPILNVPIVQSTAPSFEDPLPMPTSLPQAPRTAGTQVNLVNGVGELNLSPNLAGPVELVLQDGSPLTLEPLRIQVRPLEPESLDWSFPADPVVGQDFEIEVKAVDARGSLCSGFAAECSLEIRGAETRSLTLRLENGRASIKVENTKAEKWEVKLRYGGTKILRYADTKFVEWQPGPAVRLMLEGPADINAGSPLKVVVRAVDQFGNLAKSFQGSVVLEVKSA